MLKREQQTYKPIPVVRLVTGAMIQKNYVLIKQEIEDLVNAEMERIMGDPGMVGVVLRKR